MSLISAGQMSQRVRIQQPTVAKDALGAPTQTWSDIATVWADIQPISGREARIADRIAAVVSHQITVRYRSEFNDPKSVSQMRVLFRDRIFQSMLPLMKTRPMSRSCFWQVKGRAMAKVETVRIEGLAQLDRALRELPDRVANRGLRASVYAGAKVIRDEARAQAPKAAQSLGSKQPPPGTLKRSVIMKHVRELSGGVARPFMFWCATVKVPQSRQAREPIARCLVLALC